MELRWKFKINVNVEETGKRANNKGFFIRQLEGQSRTYEEPYPLNQIEIKGCDLGSKVKVVVSPTVTQVYFNVKDVSEISELENAIMDLVKVEEILNNVVVFTKNETARFSMETEIPVMSIGMLKAQHVLKERIHKAFEDLYELIFKEISLFSVLCIEGRISYAIARLDIFSNKLVDMLRELIQKAKEQGIMEAEKWEDKFLQFEAELASARSPHEFEDLFAKYFGQISNSE